MRKVPLFISIVVTLALLYVLLRQASVTQIVSAFGSISIWTVALGFALYLLVQLFRSLRSWFLLQGKVPVSELFSITCVHNAMVNALPARTGELSYVYLLKKSGQSVGTGVGTLALARIFDLLAMGILFALAAVLVSDLPDFVLQARLPALIFVAVVVLLLLLMVVFSTQTVLVLNAVVKLLGLKGNKVATWVLAKAEETLHSLHVVKSWKPVVGALSCSIGVWLLLFTVNFLIFSGIGVTQSFVLVVLASSVSSLLSSLPIQGIAGFGTTEAFWTIALIGIGIAPEVAVVAGFTQHLIALLYIFLLGVYGFWTRP